MENAKFRFQAPIDQYVTVFACHGAKLIVELDGSQHAGNQADRERYRVLESAGYRVLRFWNSDIFGNLDGVLEEIRQAVLDSAGQ